MTKISMFIAAALALPALAAAAPADEWKGRRAEHRAELLKKYDLDQDGRLSPEEKAQLRHDFATARFQQLDTNGDGVLTPDEFEAGAHRRRHSDRHHGPRADGADEAE